MASRLLSRSRSTLFDTSSTTADDPSSSAQHLPSSSSGLTSDQPSSSIKSRDNGDEQDVEYTNIFGTRPAKQRNPSYTNQSTSPKNERRRSKGGFLNAVKSIASNANPRKSPQEPQKSFEVIRVKRKPAGTTPPAGSNSSAFSSSPHPDSSPKPSTSDLTKQTSSATDAPSDTSAFSLIDHESGTLPPDSQTSYFPPLRLVTSDSTRSVGSQPFSAADEYSASKDDDDVDEDATEQPHQSPPINTSTPGSDISTTRSPPVSSTNKKHRSSFVALTRRFSGLSGYDLAGGRPTASPPATSSTNLTGTHTSPSAATTGSFTLRSMRNVTDGGNPGARASTLYHTNTTHDTNDTYGAPTPTVTDSPTHDFPEPITAPQSPLITLPGPLPDHVTSPLAAHDQATQAHSPLASPALSPSLQGKPFYAQPHSSSISVAKFKNPRTRSESGTFSANATFDQLGRPSSPRPASPSVGVGLLQTPDGLRPSEQLAALEAELAIGGRVTPMMRQLEERFENSALRSHSSHTHDSSIQRPAGAPLDARSVFATPPAVPGKDPWLLNRQRRQTSLDASLLLRGASSDGSAFSPPAYDPTRRSRRLSDRFGASAGTAPENQSGLHLSSSSGAAGIHPDISPAASSSPHLNNGNVRGSGRGWDSATFLSSFKGSGNGQPKTLLDALSQMEAEGAREGRGEQMAAASRDTAAASPSVAERLLAPFASARQNTPTMPPAASPANAIHDQLSVDSNIGIKEPRDSISQSSTTSTSRAADVLLALAATPEATNSLETEEETYFPAVTELPVRDTATLADSAVEHDTPRMATQSPDNPTLDANPPGSRSDAEAEGAALTDGNGKQSTEADDAAYHTARRPSLRSGSTSAGTTAHREHRYGIDPVTMDLWQKHTDAVYGIGQAPPMSPIGKHRKARSVSHTSRPRSKKQVAAGESNPPPVPDSPESTRYWLDQRPAVQVREPPSPGAAAPLVRASTMSSAARGASTSTQAQQELASLPRLHAVPVAAELPQGQARAQSTQRLSGTISSARAPLDVNTLLSVELPLGIHPGVWSSLTVEGQAQIRAHYAQAVQAARMACQRAYESQMAPIWSQLSGPSQRTTLAPETSKNASGNGPTGTSGAVTRQRTLSQPEQKPSEGPLLGSLASQATQIDGHPVALYPPPSSRGPTPRQTDQMTRGAAGGGPDRQGVHPEVYLQNTMRAPQQSQQQLLHQQPLPAGSGPSWQSGAEQYRGPQYRGPPGNYYQPHAQPRPRPMSQSSGRPPSGPVHYPQQQYRPYNDPREQYGLRPQHVQPPPQHHPYWQHPQRPHERPPDVYSQMPGRGRPSQETNPRPSNQGMRPSVDQSGNAGPSRSNNPYQASHQATSNVSLHRPGPPPSQLPRRPSVPNLRVATEDIDRGPSAKFMATPVVDTSSVPLPAFDAPPDASQAGALLTDELKRLNQTRGVTPGEYSTTKRFID